MTTIISFVSGGLAILVPLLFARLVMSKDSNQPNAKRLLTFGIIAWSMFVWILGSIGVFEYQSGDILPRFLIPLFIPVLIIMPFIFRKSTAGLFEKISLDQLVGFQFWRIFGAIFFLVALSGIGPADLMASGFGDLITGLLAINAYFFLKAKHKLSKTLVWGFMMAGAFDLLGVLYILLANYPIWSEANPSSAIAGSMPMILIVGIVAPIALIFHILTLKKLLTVTEMKSVHEVSYNR